VIGACTLSPTKFTCSVTANSLSRFTKHCLTSPYLAKLSLCLTNYAQRHEYVWASGCIQVFLTSALVGGERSGSPPTALYTEKEPQVSTGRAPEPVWMMWKEDRNLAPTGTRTPTSRPSSP
jgi:hypothetical protein